ncbi:MAG: hypothetical protein K2L49_00490, partial [Muribaculaceae bacterium]|nr:hypothetical protein [Muribaculaceae bacterium]
MNYVIYIVALFSTVGFFNYHGALSDAGVRAIYYMVSILALVIALTERRTDISKIDYPRTPYRILMVMVCLSPVISNIFHDQPMKEAVITALPTIL